MCVYKYWVIQAKIYTNYFHIRKLALQFPTFWHSIWLNCRQFGEEGQMKVIQGQQNYCLDITWGKSDTDLQIVISIYL